MEKNRQLPRFVSQRGNPIDLIVSESQLQRFLSQEWREKSKRIAGENGLTIEHTTGYWHFNFMRRGRRYHKTLGRYPCVSLQQAREICREIREAIIAGRAESVVSQVRKNEQPAKLIHKKTIDSLVSDYFIYRLNSLKEAGTNKAPVKAVHRMQNLYESYLRTYPAGEKEAIWKSVLEMCDLFEIVAREVSQALGFSYNEEEGRNSRAWLEHVYKLPKDAKEIC